MFNSISKHTSFRCALLASALFVTGAGMSHADYTQGSNAFNSGNYAEAYQEFKQSADSGNSLGQFMMGRLYAEGRGVVEDKVAAYMWYDLSASNGNSRAIAARDLIADQLDADDIDRAQDLAAEWRTSRAGASTATQAPAVVYAPANQTYSQPYSLRNVQVALYNLGYAVGTPDGVIGPKSRAAIRAYQVDTGLPTSGEPSIALHEKLQASLAQRTGPAKPAPQPTMGPAMISEAQTALRQRGYTISVITGTANAETAAAVRAYQADAHLPVTGEISDGLMQQLRTASADSGAIYRAQVKQVQAALNASGYSAGPADGALGPKSRAAISRYQSDKGLAATGEVNGELLASLGIEGEGPMPTPVVNAKTIRETKKELRTHGYVIENMNGKLDLATREAIRAYQSDAGLDVTGEVTLALLEHLRGAAVNDGGGDTQLTLDVEDQLRRHGYTVSAVDGILDASTRQAILAYQADAGLAATGKADYPLLAHLRGSDMQALPSSVIAETQWILIRLGYLDAESDGIMGSASAAAIRSYQEDRGLVVTGRPSVALLTKLRAEPGSEPGAGNL